MKNEMTDIDSALQLALQLPEEAGMNWFLDRIQEGVTAWYLAAAFARKKIGLDEDWPDRVAAKSRIFSATAIHRLANIGVKYIPELAISESPGAKRLRKLPIELQRKFWNGHIPLLIQQPDGQWEELLTEVENLQPAQAMQVIADDHIRTTSEQRTWLEERRANVSSQPNIEGKPPLEIKGRELRVYIPCTLTKDDLIRYAAMMK